MAFADVIRTDAIFPQPSHFSHFSLPSNFELWRGGFTIDFPCQRRQSSQIFFFPLSRIATTRMKWTIAIDERAAESTGEQEVVGNGGGGGKLERQRMDLEGRECKILQPRGTHGDVISTTEPETYYNPAVRQPRSHSVSMYEWPILLGLSLGKSIYSDYRPSSCAPPLRPGWLGTNIAQPVFSLTHSTYTVEFAEQRFHFSLAPGTKMMEPRGGETLLALQISFIMTLNHNPLRWLYHSECGGNCTSTRDRREINRRFR